MPSASDSIRVNVAEYMLAQDVALSDGGRSSILEVAAATSQSSIVGLLLDRHSNRAHDAHVLVCRSAVQRAAQHGHREIISQIVDWLRQ